MNPWSVLGRVRVKSLAHAVFLGMGHPLFLGPTIKATRACVRISTAHYGKLHHRNGPANAFRHALWNYLIGKACAPWSSREERAIAWAERITLWHEESFPNKEPARRMDLHNNAVGRAILQEQRDQSQEEVIRLLMEMTERSVLIDRDTDLTELKNQLVHIIGHEG